MDSNIKVSVVVPIYNVEKYLKQCLDSLINQTLEDIEIICVNDGSTDSSLEILEEYASRDSRVKIITQKNKGLSGARNTGMEHIRGQFTFFIDSDDWMDVNALEELYKKASNQDLDMLFCQILNFNENTGQMELTEYGGINAVDSSFDERVFTYRDILNVLFKIPHSAFNKLYKTSFLKDLNAEFPQGLNYEDILFFFSVFLKATKVSILRKPLYFYRVRDDSIMGSAGEKSLDIFSILSKTQNILNQTDILETHLQDFLLYVVVNLKNVYSTVRDDFKEQYFLEIKNHYDDFNLDKVDKNYVNWHYSDRSFHKAINPVNTSREFDLMVELLSYKFLANHYKTLYEQSQIVEEPKTFKNRFKKILNK